MANEREHLTNQLTTSSSFLQRAEQQRLDRECFCLLDLRKLANDFCRRYSYRGRTLWLDASARQTFLEGLKQNGGTFTVGTYEAILEAYPPPSPKGPLRQEYHQNSIFEISLKNRRPPRPDGTHNSVFELGYFEKRVDKRVRHVTPVLLLAGGKVIPAETRDISFRGLQIRAKTAIQIQPGEAIKVKIAPTAAGGEKLAEAVYRVVRVKPLLSEVIVSLLSDEPRSNETLQYFRHIVSTEAGTAFTSSNLDLEDSLLTSHSALAERCYMRASTIIPLFLFKTSSEQAPLKIVFSNHNNAITLRAFETSPGHHDLSALARHTFIRTLVSLANRDSQSDMLLAVQRSRDGNLPLAFTQNEFKESGSWYGYLAQHIDDQDFYVFKVLARFVQNPALHRILSDLDQLATQSTDLAEKLLKEAENLYIAGSLIDVTEQVRGWELQRLNLEADSPQFQPPQPENDEHLPAPEVWPVRYIEENRSENRFTGQMRLILQHREVRYGARSRDLSTRGLSAYSDDPDIPIAKGAKVLVSFPALKKNSGPIERLRSGFGEIPYEVVGITRGTPTLIRMKQSSDEQGTRLARILSGFIDQRRAKLPVELSHVYRSAASRLYSSHFIQSSGTIPFFVSRQKDGQKFGTKVGIVQSPSYLSQFFEVADEEHDFTVLMEALDLGSLITRAEQEGSAEASLFLYKTRIPGTQRFRIVALDPPKSRNRHLETSFVNSLGNPDFRYVKLVVARPQLPPKIELDQAVNRLQSAPKAKVEHLISEFTELAAVGDIVDVTGQYGALQPFRLLTK